MTTWHCVTVGTISHVYRLHGGPWLAAAVTSHNIRIDPGFSPDTQTADRQCYTQLLVFRFWCHPSTSQSKAHGFSKLHRAVIKSQR